MEQALHALKSPHHERRWLILGVIAIAQLMVVLDVTIVNIALPSAQEDLVFSDASRQWVITAYALAFGSLLLLGGKISDLVGRKRTFIAGLLGFAGASAIGGAAPSFEVLVSARALQGAFAALLAPAALSIVTTTFTDPGERGKAFGIYGAMASSGAAVGLLLGGFLTELVSWRWTMYVNLAFALPAAFAGFRLLTSLRPTERPRIDAAGAIVATGGLFALVYGFANAEMDGWDAPLTVALLAVGAVAIVGFVFLERRVASPLLPLHVVADRDRGGAFLAIGTIGVAAFATFLFLTYYLQRILAFSPIETGLALLPMVAVVLLSSAITATRMLPRLGPKPLVAVGLGGRCGRDRLPHAHRGGLLLRQRRPSGHHARGGRIRHGHGSRFRHRHRRSSSRGGRGRLGDGQRLAADRRLAWRRVTLHAVCRRGERLHPGGWHPGRPRAGRGSRAGLHSRLLVGGRHPRGGVADLRWPAALRGPGKDWPRI